MTADTREIQLRRVERLIARLLAIGVGASLALLVLGTIVCFVRGDYGGEVRALVDAHEVPSAADIARGVAEFRGPSIVLLGLIVLLATPVLRVTVSIIAFAAERDRIFAVITSIVLALLIVSFLLGGVHQ